MIHDALRCKSIGLRICALLVLVLGTVLLSSCRGLTAARHLVRAGALWARTGSSISADGTATAVTLSTIELTPRPTAGPFTDADALRNYLAWVEADYKSFTDGFNTSMTALGAQATRTGQCDVALFDSSALLQAATKKQWPEGLRHTHLDFVRMMQEWELARAEMTQLCSESDAALGTVDARTKIVADLSAGVVKDLYAASDWLNGTRTPAPYKTPNLKQSPSSTRSPVKPANATSVPMNAPFVSSQPTNLRLGPGPNFRAIRPVPANEACAVLDHSDDATWLLVRCADGKEGWVLASMSKNR